MTNPRLKFLRKLQTHFHDQIHKIIDSDHTLVYELNQFSVGIQEIIDEDEFFGNVEADLKKINEAQHANKNKAADNKLIN